MLAEKRNCNTVEEEESFNTNYCKNHSTLLTVCAPTLSLRASGDSRSPESLPSNSHSNTVQREREESTQTDEDQSTQSSTNPDENDQDEETVIEKLTRRMSGLVFSQERQNKGTQTSRDPFEVETENLSYDIVNYTLGRQPCLSSSDKVANCMRKCVKKMLENHAILFNSMVNRLTVSSDSDLTLGFNVMCNELFLHEEVSWAKVIALFSFAARLAQYCDENGYENQVNKIAQNLTRCSLEKLKPFLLDHGGWATLCDAFPQESDYEAKVWKTLLLTGFGLTIVVTFLALNH